MIRALAFSIMFCLLIGLLQAQAETCNDADWDALEATRNDYIALRSDIAAAAELDALLPIARGHIQWRDALLESLPPCAEARELAILMTQVIGDAVTNAAAERMPGASVDDLKIADYLLETDARIEAYFAPDRPLDSSAGAPEPGNGVCSLTEANDDYDLNAGWRRIAESTAETSGRAEALSSAELLLEWRAQLWAQLHNCWDVFEVLYRFNLITGDYLTGAGLRDAGLRPSKIPYYPSIEANLQRIRDLLNARHAAEPGVGLELQVNLPDCGKDALQTISPDDKDFLKLWLALRAGLETVEDILAWNESMLAWRDANLLTVPRCREAIHFALVKSWILGDYNPSLLVDAMGIPAEDNGYERERRIQIRTYGDLMSAVDSMDPSELPTDENDALPACDEAQLDEFFKYGFRNFEGMIDKATGIATNRDFVEYGIYRLTWRDFHWRLLPPCGEALELALVMNAFEMDALAYLTLRSLNLPEEDNPFPQSLSRNRERMRQMAAAAGRDVDGMEP